MEPLNICVMGLGYIGLPTASLLATKGCQVRGVDVKPDVIDTINAGKIHIVEPDLDALVHSAVSSGRLTASLEPGPAEIFIVAVPTPFTEGHKPDVSYVRAATTALAAHLQPDNLIILESTSPIGTTELMAEIIRTERPDLVHGDTLAVHVAHCPERVMPGQILQEIVENDRIVGGLTTEATEKASAFYRGFVNGLVLSTDCRTAEMAKLTENSYRDTNIAFANELSIICHKLGIDVWELIKLANHHPRVNILRPGPGVGGHCLAVDPWFIVAAAPEEARLIRQARVVNEGKVDWVVERVLERASRLKTPVIGCMGLAYKPDIDDLRESPALAVTRRLKEALPDAEILACEPNLESFDEFPLAKLDEVLKRADIIVGLVSHRSFRNLARNHLEGKMVIDTCGVFL
ncbi:MAG: UDP-N-acetyl-D-mannosamine dehydrogenase [Myxococcota bacterium]|nr:UDP-N-acetyl-D-mannosamine dehydrogenase [Myxococcota bacterium]